MNWEYDKDTGAEASDLGGRPTRYDPSFCDQVRRLARLGLPCTTEQLATFYDVSERTIERWSARFPQFCQSIKEGQLHTDCLVAEKLFERAVGVEFVEQQVLKVKRVEYHENGKKALETEEIEVVEVRRVLPPDIAAAKYWLKNRQPNLWTEKPVVAVVQDQYVLPEDRPQTALPLPRARSQPAPGLPRARRGSLRRSAGGGAEGASQSDDDIAQISG